MFRESIKSENTLYVHYGSGCFDRKRFRRAENMDFNLKPRYGLWGSPVHSKRGWKAWCMDNGYRDDCDEPCFYFRLRGWQVYEIETLEDWENLPHFLHECRKDPLLRRSPVPLDFVKIQQGSLSCSALDIKIDQLDDRDLIENHDAKQNKKPVTLLQLLPLRWYKTLDAGLEVSVLRQRPDGKIYVYCEKPDPHYFFKSIVACISDGRVVETCGYSLEEAQAVVPTLLSEKQEIIRFAQSFAKEKEEEI